jgi:hypothetical protein
LCCCCCCLHLFASTKVMTGPGAAHNQEKNEWPHNNTGGEKRRKGWLRCKQAKAGGCLRSGGTTQCEQAWGPVDVWARHMTQSSRMTHPPPGAQHRRQATVVHGGWLNMDAVACGECEAKKWKEWVDDAKREAPRPVALAAGWCQRSRRGRWMGR